MSGVKVRAQIGERWDPVTWDGDSWEDPAEAVDFVHSDAEGFIQLEEVVFPSSAEDVFQHLPLVGISLSLSTTLQQTALKEMPDKKILVSLRALQCYP